MAGIFHADQDAFLIVRDERIRKCLEAIGSIGELPWFQQDFAVLFSYKRKEVGILADVDSC
jgi:hypothetical protein